MIRRELRPMIALATPVVLAEIGWVAMGIVDTLMVGRLSADAIGAVGLASMLFFAIAVFAMGLLLGLDPLVAQAFGAGRVGDCHRWLVDGVWLAAIVSVPTVALALAIDRSMRWWGLPPAVLALSAPYMAILTWSLPPLLLYVAFRRYLQAMNVVRPVMVALVVANAINAGANWLLIFGHWGAPAMGVRGSAYSTLIARLVLAVMLYAAIFAHERRTTPRLRDTALGFRRDRIAELLRLGLPAGGQAVLEVGVFAAATALAGRVSASSLAAHQIALNFASLTFMVPFGLSSAAAVRVGQAVGRDDSAGARTAGWTAIALGVAFMAIAAIVFFTTPRPLIRAFTSDPAVIETGAALLFVAAVFQMFDGLQAVTTGALRGLGDTRTPMLWNLAGHWLLGLPIGYTLCFAGALGVVGLWWGLSAGLMVCGVSLLIVWARRQGMPVRGRRRSSHS